MNKLISSFFTILKPSALLYIIEIRDKYAIYNNSTNTKIDQVNFYSSFSFLEKNNNNQTHTEHIPSPRRREETRKNLGSPTIKRRMKKLVHVSSNFKIPPPPLPPIKPGTRLERPKNILSNKLERKKGMEEEESRRLSFSGVEGRVRPTTTTAAVVEAIP